VKKDFRLFLVDRQAVVMSLVVPLLIASILGWLDSKASAAKPSSKIPLLFVDQDHSVVSARIWTRLGRSEMVVPEAIDLEHAKARVSTGESVEMLVIVLTNGLPKRLVKILVKACIYPHRTTRRHCDHCNSCCDPVSCLCQCEGGRQEICEFE
jgi:hypothetical protein